MELLKDMPVEEFRGIGMENESSLHSSVKKWYYKPGDRFEVKVDGFIADIVRDELIIEIQTRNFSAIRRKLYHLLQNHAVKLVYPVPEEKFIVKLSPSSGEILSRRRSPKRGKYLDLFYELVRMPEIVNNDNFSLEVLIIVEEDIFLRDGRGSWKRKGDSVVDKKLLSVKESMEFKQASDFLIFLPDTLPGTFTNKIHSKILGCQISVSQKITYCLRKMGLLRVTGKKGNELIFEIVEEKNFKVIDI